MERKPTNLETRKLLSELKKHSKKKKQRIWNEIAERIKKPRRKRISVNLWKIERLSKQFNGKILVVPGKILATGEITGKIELAGFECSTKAKKKILEKGGKFISLRELMQKGIEPKNIAIIG